MDGPDRNGSATALARRMRKYKSERQLRMLNFAGLGVRDPFIVGIPRPLTLENVSYACSADVAHPPLARTTYPQPRLDKDS